MSYSATPKVPSGEPEALSPGIPALGAEPPGAQAVLGKADASSRNRSIAERVHQSQVDSLLSYVIAIVMPAPDAIFPVLPSDCAVPGHWPEEEVEASAFVFRAGTFVDGVVPCFR
jgi:hypothetical protein